MCVPGRVLVLKRKEKSGGRKSHEKGVFKRFFLIFFCREDRAAVNCRIAHPGEFTARRTAENWALCLWMTLKLPLGSVKAEGPIRAQFSAQVEGVTDRAPGLWTICYGLFILSQGYSRAGRSQTGQHYLR